MSNREQKQLNVPQQTKSIDALLTAHQAMVDDWYDQRAAEQDQRAGQLFGDEQLPPSISEPSA